MNYIKKTKISLEPPKNIITSMQPQQCIIYFEQISDYADTQTYTQPLFSKHKQTCPLTQGMSCVCLYETASVASADR